MSRTYHSPRAINQRDYVPGSRGGSTSSEGNQAARGGGPWTPTVAHLPQVSFNPLAPEVGTLPGGGGLQWSPGVPRNPELDARRFDDLHGSVQPPLPRPTARAPPKQLSEPQSSGVVMQHWAARALQLLLLLGATATLLVTIDPTLADGIDLFRDGNSGAAGASPGGVLPPPSPSPMYLQVVDGADSCEAAGCASIDGTEECAAAAMDVLCDVGTWYCLSELCSGDPVAVSRLPTDVLTHAGALATYAPGCSISVKLVQRMGRAPAPTPTVNFRSDPVSPASQNPLPRCSDATRCVCDCQQLIRSRGGPSQQWWCHSTVQTRDAARPPAISAGTNPACEPEWPSCGSAAVEGEAAGAAEEGGGSDDTAKSSGSAQRSELQPQPAVARATLLLAGVYLAA